MTAFHTCFARIGPLTNTSRPSGAQSPDQGETAQTGRDPDLGLVRRCAQRDPAALREIVQRYQRPLSRFLQQILGSPEDAEEALQDVFLRAWQQADGFQAQARVSTWLYRIATYAARDILRRRSAQRRTPPLAADVAVVPNAETQALHGLEQRERAGQLHAALLTLRPEDRLLVALYYGEEMGYEEIREITGCSSPVLKMRLLRARRRLRAALESLTDKEAE